jgi:hypothetical protein
MIRIKEGRLMDKLFTDVEFKFNRCSVNARKFFETERREL